MESIEKMMWSRRWVAAAAACVLGACGAAATASASGAEGVPAPVAQQAQDPAEVFSYERVFGTPMGGLVRMDNVDLGDGRVVDLDLRRFRVLEHDARVISSDGENETELDMDVITLQGTIRGEPESRVFLGMSLSGVHGYIQAMDGVLPQVYSISSGPFGQQGPAQVTPPRVMEERAREAALGNLGGDAQASFCHADSIPQPFAHVFRELERPALDTPSTLGTGACRVVSVAVDTDWPLSQRFGGNAQAAADYVVTLMGAVSTIYQRDVSTRLEIPFIRVWENSNDPWTAGNTSGMLSQFRNHWLQNFQDQERDLAHLLSGDGLGGGIAYLSVVCNTSNGYGVSANLNGSFPMPIRDNSSSNWDLMVTAHELGHNFGSGHTHEAYTPPIDGCGSGDCSDRLDSTIMSYCHLCSGGLSNIDLRFHPRVISRINNYLDNVACNITVGEAFAGDDFASTFQGIPVELDVTVNDAAPECVRATLGSFDAVSANGGTVELTGETTIDGDPILRYTPDADFAGQDTFSYTLNEGGSGTVFIEVEGMRAAAQPVLEDPDVRAEFYVLDRNYVTLPVFSTQELVLRTTVEEVDFPAGSGDFAGTGLTELFGAIFEMYVDIPQDGVWTISIESDDGSRLRYGFGSDAEPVLDNNGLHPMRELFVELPLRAGKHPFRIEYFQAGGDMGLIMRMEGPGFERQVIPGSLLNHEYFCPPDINRDRAVNVLDVIAFIEAWSAGDPSTDLTDLDGGITIYDVLAYFEMFNEGC